MTNEINIRVVTFLLYFILVTFWKVAEILTLKEKPENSPVTQNQRLRRGLLFCAVILLWLQLLGIRILTFPHSSSIQIFGLILTIIGVVLCFVARFELGHNWSHGV